MKKYKRTISKKWLIALVVSICTPLTIIFAQEITSIPENPQKLLPYPDYDAVKLEKERKANIFLERLKAELVSSENELASINLNLTDNSQKLTDTQVQINNLKDQIVELDKQVSNTESMIANVEKQIKTKNSEIEVLDHEIEVKKVEISYQKSLITNYLEVIYKDQSRFNSLGGDSMELSTLKLLLNEGSVGDTLSSIKYSEILEQNGKNQFQALKDLIDQENLKQKILEIKRHSLSVLNTRLEDEKTKLQEQQTIKKEFLDQTRGQEKIYQEIIAKFKQEQEAAAADLSVLKSNLEFVQKKKAELGSNFNPNDFTGMLNGISQKELSLYLETKNVGEFAPIWPVNSSRGISAYFHEESYRLTMGMVHQAIDIRIAQSTPVRAPADGFVYKAKDNGFGYSYIILMHKNGYMTVVGHMSEILVKPGDYMKAGDVIGLSGGMPGTKGAGRFTTGPHLHFEIIKDGVHVDPMLYMNLAYLNLESLPQKYVVKAMSDRKKVRREVLVRKVKRERLSAESLAEMNGDNAQITPTSNDESSIVP